VRVAFCVIDIAHIATSAATRAHTKLSLYVESALLRDCTSCKSESQRAAPAHGTD
jgi:hypothetical protein